MDKYISSGKFLHFSTIVSALILTLLPILTGVTFSEHTKYLIAVYIRFYLLAIIYRSPAKAKWNLKHVAISTDYEYTLFILRY